MNTPTSTDALLQAVVAPAVTDAVTQATAALEGRLTSVESAVAAAAVAAAPALIADLGTAGGAVLVNLERDPLTQRVVVWAFVGAALTMAVVIAAAAMLGNATANRWILSAPGLVVGAALWVSNSGATATHKVVPTAPPSATVTIGTLTPAPDADAAPVVGS